MTTRFTPRWELTLLVNNASIEAKTVTEWHLKLDQIADFANLTESEKAWLAGVRYLGARHLPHI